jgi:hypothetical protein
MKAVAVGMGSWISSVVRQARGSVHDLQAQRRPIDLAKLTAEVRTPADPEFERALLDMSETLELEALLSDPGEDDPISSGPEPFPETGRFERDFRASPSRDFLQDYLEALAPSGDATAAFSRTR